ncbi:taurine catabolism dioxygenase TauD [Beijerinckiaceae bacterium]|nr:taurine catabolism dioxygenase TauD [Beijerinckiaceae bacterium]
MSVIRNSVTIGSARRRPVSLQPEDMVEHRFLPGFGNFPLVIEARIDRLRLSAWAAGRRAELEELATRHGAVLLRGFAVADVAEFEDCVEKMCGSALEYRFRASPRTEVGRHVYTATDYPADQVIFPHNEHAYSPICPNYLIFHCDTPAREGGETPIADNREITRRIDAAVKERFLRRGVLYVRNYGAGFGLPWTTVFQSHDRAEVERYCASIGIEWQWKPGGRLCTRQTGPAMIRHPRTNEEIWFNHATFFHVTTLPAAVRDALLAEFGEDDLPTQTYYGDGTPIEAETLEHLRGIYRETLRAFAWQTNDVLLLDNILTVHGRAPFSGVRKILVAMAQIFQPRDWAIETGVAS